MLETTRLGRLERLPTAHNPEPTTHNRARPYRSPVSIREITMRWISLVPS